MITRKTKTYIPGADGYDVIEAYLGKSTDEKPELKQNYNGSTFYELDTGEVFMFDGETLEWIAQ